MFPAKRQSEKKVVFSLASSSIQQPNEDKVMACASSIEVVENGVQEDSALVYASSSSSQPNPKARIRTQRLVQKFTKGCACPKCMDVMWSNLDRNDPNVNHDGRTCRPEIDDSDDLDFPNTLDIITEDPLPGNVSLDPEFDDANVEVLEKYWPILMGKMDNGRLVLCEFLKNKPTALPIFLELLTKEIRFKPNAQTTIINMDMKRLLDKPISGGKYSVYHHVINDLPENSSALLSHPLITALTKMKQAKFSRIYGFLFVYQLFLTVCLTVSALTILVPETPSHHPYPIVEFVLYTIFILTLAKTGLSFVVDTTAINWNTFRNIAETVCIFVVLTACHFRNYDINSYNIKDFSGFAVLTSWLLLLTYMTRFSNYAVYVQTYFQVMKYYVRFLLTVASFQIIGFAAAYLLIFSKIDGDNTSIFTKASRSFVLVLSARMNYADFTNDESTINNVFSVFSYFVIFVICSTVMLACIINLAQNGSKNLKKASAIKVLRQDVIDIGKLERLYRKLKKYRCFPRSIANWLLKMSSIEDYFVPNSDKMLEFKLEEKDNGKDGFSNNWRKVVYNFLIEKKLNCGGNYKTTTLE